MHDVPTHLCLRVNGFHGLMQQAIHLFLAAEPEPVPFQDFGIFEQQSPQRDKATVPTSGTSLENLLHPLVQRGVSRAYALNLDSLIGRFAGAILAEAVNP